MRALKKSIAMRSMVALHYFCRMLVAVLSVSGDAGGI